MTAPAVSLVMPAYNSVRYVDDNVGRALAFFDAAGIDAQIVLADDGSTDGTADSIRSDPRVTVLRLPHAGKGAAVRAGMSAATGEIRAFTDGDLPYGLERLPLAMRYITERRYHAVIGDRTLPGSDYESTGPLRTVVSELASFAFRTLVTGGIYDTQCGFKVFRGDVARDLFARQRIDGYMFDVEVLALARRAGYRIKEVGVRWRDDGDSRLDLVAGNWRNLLDLFRIRFGGYGGAGAADAVRTKEAA